MNTSGDIFNFIKQRVEDAAREKAATSQQLEACRNDKIIAEAAKEKAVTDVDEQAYKDACRMIAEAEAGIEFNSRLLQKFERKQYANEAEDAKVQKALTGIRRDICNQSFDEIERALSAALAAANEALSKLGSVNTMADAWNTQIMKTSYQLSQFQQDANRSAINISSATITLNQVKSICTARLDSIKSLREHLGESI